MHLYLWPMLLLHPMLYQSVLNHFWSSFSMLFLVFLVFICHLMEPTREGVGGNEYSGHRIFVTFIIENWICAMIRHHAEPNSILLKRNLLIDSGVREWSHHLMILLHCLCAKSNNRTCDQFECDVTWFCFCFDFIRSHARCGCYSIVCWRGLGEGGGGGST